MAKDILTVLFTNFPCMIFHSSVENYSQCEYKQGLLHKRDLEGAEEAVLFIHFYWDVLYLRI